MIMYFNLPSAGNRVDEFLDVFVKIFGEVEFDQTTLHWSVIDMDTNRSKYYIRTGSSDEWRYRDMFNQYGGFQVESLPDTVHVPVPIN